MEPKSEEIDVKEEIENGSSNSACCRPISSTIANLDVKNELPLSTTNDAGCSNTKDKGKLESSFKVEEYSRNMQPVSSNTIIPMAMEAGPSNIIMQSNRPTTISPIFPMLFPPPAGPSNMIMPSNRTSFSPPIFPMLFPGLFLNTTDVENPAQGHKTPQTFVNETMQFLKNGNSPRSHQSRKVPNDGINLREWLESNCFNSSKNERLQVFMKILHMVDIQHNQGIALVDLKPSSFTLFKTGNVKYTGSLMKSHSPADNTKKRSGLEPPTELHTREKMQKVAASKDNIDPMNYAQNSFLFDQGTSIWDNWMKLYVSQLETQWYSYPQVFKIRDLRPSNIYSLGILLFELLCHFDSMHAHSITMFAMLYYRIFPPYFILENSKEAGFCFWLLHLEESSRPTIRNIMQCELIHEIKSMTCPDDIDDEDVETELLLHFLKSLEKRLKKKASNLTQSIELVDNDLKVIEGRREAACKRSSDMIAAGCSSTDFNLKDQRGATCSTSSKGKNVLIHNKFLGNINELENLYFSAKSKSREKEKSIVDRVDKGILTKRERLYCAQDPPSSLPAIEQIFFDGICKFGRYKKFEVCGTLKNIDILNANGVVSSLSFDRDEEYIASAGVSKKIKIFEFNSLLDDSVDIQYPVLEMSSNSKFSCVSWNKYIKNFLASTECNGLVQMWDANTGQGIVQYNKHKKRAWSVDFSQTDPKKFITGGDDCSVKIWNIDESNSTCTLRSPSNVCCVQFSPYSSHLVAFGSAERKIYFYDLRHTRLPWCTLSGHGDTVSYVKFLDPETIVSSSIDNTLKLWDLKQTSIDGLSPNASSLTYKGHTNLKTFVGLDVLDGYIACGSESNEVYAYYRSLSMPIACHKFGYIDPLSGKEKENTGENVDHFVSSVCWRKKSQMLVANSSSTMKILRMV